MTKKYVDIVFEDGTHSDMLPLPPFEADMRTDDFADAAALHVWRSIGDPVIQAEIETVFAFYDMDANVADIGAAKQRHVQRHVTVGMKDQRPDVEIYRDAEFGFHVFEDGAASVLGMTMLYGADLKTFQQPISGYRNARLSLNVDLDTIDSLGELYGPSPIITQLQRFRLDTHQDDRQGIGRNWPHSLTAMALRWASYADFDHVLMAPAQVNNWYTDSLELNLDFGARYNGTAKAVGFKKCQETGFYVYPTGAESS